MNNLTNNRSLFRSALVALIFPVMFVLPCSALPGQDESANQRIDALEKRLATIESRLVRIENVLFATIRYSEAEARQELARAKETLAQSEKLQARGLISAAQLELDRMSLQRASTLLNMCVKHEDHRKIGAVINMLDAKQLLAQKRLDLLRAEKLFEKGFIAKQQIAKDRSELLLVSQKLELAENRLKELETVLSKEKSGQETPKRESPDKVKPKSEK